MILDHFRDGVARRRRHSACHRMCIALHPYMMGQPHRIRHLDRALGQIMAREGVWQATRSGDRRLVHR